MALTPRQFAKGFIGHLKYLERTRIRMENLYAKKIVVRRDIELVYGGIYLESVTSFERFIEGLFIRILSGKVTYSTKRVMPRVVFKSMYVASLMIHGGRSYLDWLPYRYTLKRADAYLRKGAPFGDLNKNDIKNLEVMSYVRNAIAHKSKQAYQMFDTNVVAGLALTTREKSPLGYLRSVFAVSPTQTRYQEIVNNMGLIALKLCK